MLKVTYIELDFDIWDTYKAAVCSGITVTENEDKQVYMIISFLTLLPCY